MLKQNNKTKLAQVRLTDQEHEGLVKSAKKLGVTLSDLIRSALEKYWQKKGE